jgi:hypothetical protein
MHLSSTREELKMTDMNKEAISVLNDLIETSKDGQEGFKT